MNKEELLKEIYKLKRTTFKSQLTSFLDYETISLTDVIVLVEQLTEPERRTVWGIILKNRLITNVFIGENLNVIKYGAEPTEEPVEFYTRSLAEVVALLVDGDVVEITG